MSEFSVPSYRVRPERAGFQLPWRMLAVFGVVAGAAAIGGGLVWGVTRAMKQEVPTIEADTRPFRVKPEDPGGLRVANQEERIFESQRQGPSQGGASPQVRLTPEPERPDVEALRQAAARAQQAATAQAPAQPALPPPVLPDAAPIRPPMLNPSLGQQAAPAATPAPAEQPEQPVQQQAQQQAPVQAISPPPMPAGAPARAPARTGRFVVQLGAVSSEEAARGEWVRLQGRIPELAGYQPQITRVDRGDLPPLWRIRATGLPDAAAAKSLCDSAKTKSAPCAVIGG
ncbi:SPOR domain-containing protein [Roseomonas xinghualingensis]|uniref:SPOR domain-containing protein n=1 Tax=Roseomonas xinghualingensis TaxID=2986475 RepID=UPI0021F1E90B|nr:SPOR domain-containing protein [Roseomonas sp. SXEYE001]MCV4208604.1 SPOR domain-containing protein [Roseomonas sp. SXEYE001]